MLQLSREPSRDVTSLSPAIPTDNFQVKIYRISSANLTCFEKYYAPCLEIAKWSFFNASLILAHCFLFQSPSAVSHPRWTTSLRLARFLLSVKTIMVSGFPPPDLIIQSELSGLLVVQKTSQITKQSQGWCIISWTWLHLRIKQPNLNELQPKIREWSDQKCLFDLAGWWSSGRRVSQLPFLAHRVKNNNGSQVWCLSQESVIVRSCLLTCWGILFNVHMGMNNVHHPPRCR